MLPLNHTLMPPTPPSRLVVWNYLLLQVRSVDVGLSVVGSLRFGLFEALLGAFIINDDLLCSCAEKTTAEIRCKTTRPYYGPMW